MIIFPNNGCLVSQPFLHRRKMDSPRCEDIGREGEQEAEEEEEEEEEV